MKIIAYTDGASRGNPGRGGFGSIVIYPDTKGQVYVDELGGYEHPTTNNRMELGAILAAFEHFIDYYDRTAIDAIVGVGKVLPMFVYTDSSYALKGINEWMDGWKRNNWITSTKEPVKNADIWQKIDRALSQIKTNGVRVEWVLLPGHAGVAGNERADEIATGYADKKEMFTTELYKGLATKYQYPDLLIPPTPHEIKSAKADKDKNGKKSSSTPGYSYVSLVDGVIYVDKTWGECEKRVKGVSGVKFKKATSAADEEFIKKEFTKNI